MSSAFVRGECRVVRGECRVVCGVWCVVRGGWQAWCVASDRFHSAASSALSSRNFEKSAKPWPLSTRHSVSAARKAVRPAGRMRARGAGARAGGTDRSCKSHAYVTYCK